MKLPPLLTYVGSWAVITGGIWVLFQRAESVLKPEVKASISQWLLNLSPSTAFVNWPATFAALFDRIFGEQHRSWRCFGRSCLASLVAVAIVTLIWAAIRPDELIAFVQKRESMYLTPFVSIFFGAVFLNLIPDYLSLLETRYIIRWGSQGQSAVRILAFLSFDLLFTAAIALWAFWATCALVFFTLRQPFPLNAMEMVTGTLRHLLPRFLLPLSASETGDYSFGIFFYSTFFTSVWVWLYAASGLLIKVGKFLGIGVRGLKGFLDIEHKPLASMGFVAMLLITLLYLLTAPFVLDLAN